jgi:hypothetical protein
VRYRITDDFPIEAVCRRQLILTTLPTAGQNSLSVDTVDHGDRIRSAGPGANVADVADEFAVRCLGGEVPATRSEAVLCL